MTSLPPDLVAGYRRFRGTRYPEEAARYHQLAEGQAPDIMIIACADSRVDPATIFGAAPGELFVVRNVANLVPPCETSSDGLQSTSAAIEFAVTELHVSHIVVMGHEDCGGIAASLAAADNRPVGQFIGPWVELLSGERDSVLADGTLADLAGRRAALEFRGIRQSLENLLTFPFVANAADEGLLTLHGTWFSVGNGVLYWFNRDTGEFETVET
jgi:carbonic anhydrase